MQLMVLEFNGSKKNFELIQIKNFRAIGVAKNKLKKNLDTMTSLLGGSCTSALLTKEVCSCSFTPLLSTYSYINLNTKVVSLSHYFHTLIREIFKGTPSWGQSIENINCSK